MWSNSLNESYAKFLSAFLPYPVHRLDHSWKLIGAGLYTEFGFPVKVYSVGKVLQCSQGEQDCTIMLSQIKLHRVFLIAEGYLVHIIMEATLAVIIISQ